MSLLNDILAWSTTGLTLWQRDALRRLFQKKGLDEQDFDDLYAMLKSAHGLPDPRNRQPDPLAQKHLPAQVANAAPVILRAMRELKHVNRIPHGQKLEFAPKGMTMIYGGNAAGKSGYSRVLKQACRARDSVETVHPDAFDAKAVASIPEATFDIEIGGHASSLSWKRGVEPPDDLSTIAVFDTKCARAYLDEGDVAYLPYGLDIVENLGQRVLPVLAQRLMAEINAVNTDAAPFADLLGDTTVGKLIASLGPDTDPPKVTALATFATADTNRLAELENTLTENNPKAKAKTLRLSAQRVDGLISRIDGAIVWVNDAAVEKLKGYDTEAEAASKAEIVAAEKFRAGAPLLPGTGEKVWKILFETARRFSTEFAYLGKPFPYLGSDAQCPLCQQTLDQESAERMRRFEEFVKQDIAKFVHAQMQAHYWEDVAGYEVKVSKGYTELKSSAYSFNAEQPPADYRASPADKSNMAKYLFGGFSKCLYPVQKFDSEAERMLAVILERDALKWFRPARGQFQIYYRQGAEHLEYQPDFVAETSLVIYMLEPKASNQMEDPVVLAKRDAAVKWCANASAYSAKSGGKPWKYALMPHTAIAENMTLDGLVKQFGS